MKALFFKEFRSRSIPERALNGAKTERSIFLQVITIVVALTLASVATPIVESSDKLTYISPWVYQEVHGSNVNTYNAAAFKRNANDCSNTAFRMRLVEAILCITLICSILCSILLLLEFVDKSALRSAAVVSFIITFIFAILSLGMMMPLMYNKLCNKGSLAFSPSHAGYSFGPSVYCLIMAIVLMVAAYILLAMRRLFDRQRIKEAAEYEEERLQLKQAEFDAIAEAIAAEEAAEAAKLGASLDDDDNYTWQDVEVEEEVTDDEPDWGNDLSVRSAQSAGGTPRSARGEETADKYRKQPTLGPDGEPIKRTKMVRRVERRRVRRPKPKAPRDPNAPRTRKSVGGPGGGKPALVRQRSSLRTGPVFTARPQSGGPPAALGITGAHVAADLVSPSNKDVEVIIDIEDDAFSSVEEQEPDHVPAGTAPPANDHFLEAFNDHDAPAKPVTPAHGGLAASPYTYTGTSNPNDGFVSVEADPEVEDDFGFNPSKNRKKRNKKDVDPEMSGWGDLADELPTSLAAAGPRRGAYPEDLDNPFPAGPSTSRSEKKEKKRKKRMAYNANDVYVYTSGGATGAENEFEFQEDFTGV